MGMMSDAAPERLNTAVLFLIFCRPETTKQVFEAIRKAKPPRLYVAADGAREDSPEEADRCEQSRKIATSVDWDCEVRTLFREKNLGCGKGPSTAISWFFEHETEGIILEDDCVPSPLFFPYCSELLERYRTDTRIMHIAGTNLEKSHTGERSYAYSFSNITYCWGWATWRRAWKFYDFDMSLYKEITEKDYLEGHYNCIYERDYFQHVFAMLHNGDRRNVWDYQWQFACRINSGLVIFPTCNLVVNVGLGAHGTNTTHPRGIGYHLKLEEMGGSLSHPDFVMINTKEEKERYKRSFTSQRSRIISNIRYVVPKAVIEKLTGSFKYIFTGNKRQHHGYLKY
jgi:hypothetical protein